MTVHSNFKVVTTAGVSESARALMWEVFFASRGRGISLSVHCPWLDDPNVFCVKISDPSTRTEKIIAALVIKKHDLTVSKTVGLIGLVCVAEEWRGKNLSSLLMDEATNVAKNLNFDGLVLWTQKPKVYSGHGYVLDEREMFGYVRSRCTSKSLINFSTQVWPDLIGTYSNPGLPPFAKSGRVISTEVARVVAFDCQDGRVTVSDWAGKISDVVDLLESSMPVEWWINVATDDELVQELRDRQLDVHLEPASVRMVKYMKNLPIVELKTIKFLDRV